MLVEAIGVEPPALVTVQRSLMFEDTNHYQRGALKYWQILVEAIGVEPPALVTVQRSLMFEDTNHYQQASKSTALMVVKVVLSFSRSLWTPQARRIS
ncbi:hypothetical protein QQP08_017696 [Theobroma cacao]|nr:hypothetical protein QQP08_017696 [Theobroma cacao]